MKSYTFTIIKPNAILKGNTGKILDMIIGSGFTLEQMRLLRLTRPEAEQFYEVHRGRPFFERLVELMTSDKIIVIELSHDGPDAISEFRTLVGNTDPEKAEPGTIRALYGENVTRNAIHASDSPENAEHEASQFFPRN